MTLPALRANCEGPMFIMLLAHDACLASDSKQWTSSSMSVQAPTVSSIDQATPCQQRGLRMMSLCAEGKACD